MSTIEGPSAVAIVFGGNGFIGTHLLQCLKASGRYARLISADLRPGKFGVDGVEFVACDVRKRIEMARPEGKVDIFNLAAVHTTPGHEDWEYFTTNVSGATNVTDFAESVDCRCLVFSSSISVYGPSESRLTEQSPLAPNSAYGRSKILAEAIHRSWVTRGTDRRLVIVRPAVVFGRGEGGNFTRLAKALRRGSFFFAGRKDTIKACIYVGELVRSILFMTARDQREITYNIAYPNPYTINDICDAFCDVAGFRRPFVVVPLGLMLLGGLFFEILSGLGLKSSINRARVLKLVHSTNVFPEVLLATDYQIETDLREGLRQWQADTMKVVSGGAPTAHPFGI